MRLRLQRTCCRLTSSVIVINLVGRQPHARDVRRVYRYLRDHGLPSLRRPEPLTPVPAGGNISPKSRSFRCRKICAETGSFTFASRDLVSAMTIYLIVLISVLNQIGFSGSRVAVSLYALELGANQFTIGVLIALYALCPMLLSIAIGKFADRVAPRLPMIIGTAGMALALLLPPLFPRPDVLYVSSFLLGLFHQIVQHSDGGHRRRYRRCGKTCPQLCLDQHGIFRRQFSWAARRGILDRLHRPPAGLSGACCVYRGAHADTVCLCRACCPRWRQHAGAAARQRARSVAHTVLRSTIDRRQASLARRGICSSFISRFTAIRSGFRHPPSAPYSARLRLPLS